MSTSRYIAGILALLLQAFETLCLQARLTNRLTPDFAAQIAASIRLLNKHALSFLGLSDEQLNLVFATINAVNVLSLAQNRKLGFIVNGIFYVIALLAQIKVGEPFGAHVVLVGMAVLGFVLG